MVIDSIGLKTGLVNIKKDSLTLVPRTRNDENAIKEPIDSVTIQFGTETKKEKLGPGIHYLSEKAKQGLAQYEQLYEDLKSLKRPVVICYLDDLLSGLSDNEKEYFQLDGLSAEAAAISGRFIGETLREKLGMNKDYLYLVYNHKPNDASFAGIYHETRHLKHFDELIANDLIGEGNRLERFNKLSQNANKYFEETLTCSQTIDWLKNQETNPAQSVLNEKERAALPRAIEHQKKYLKLSYANYYRERYGGKFDFPFGLSEVKDKIDMIVEGMFKKHILPDILKKIKENK